MIETSYNSVNDRRLQELVKWLSVNSIKYDNLTVASADAGFRRYFRLQQESSTVLAVDAPPENEDTCAFLDVAARLRHSGLKPPLIHCYSLDMGFLVIEDFGPFHVQAALADSTDRPARANQLYKNAMQGVIQMQASADTTNLPVCDRKFLREELDLFPHWYLKVHHKKAVSTTQQEIIERAFSVILDSATEQPYRFMHRDYHCRNLMVLDNNAIGVIDFQGAMHGPVTYDPVSLLKDVYLDWSDTFRKRLIEQHRSSLTPDVDQTTYTRWFDLMGLQRHLKILGLFCRLNYRDNKPDYITHLPRIQQHVEDVLKNYPELTDFMQLFSALHPQRHPA